MADLLGDELHVVAGLDQPGDVGVPQAVRAQLVWQPGCGAPVRESVVDRPDGDHLAPLGREHHSVVGPVDVEQRPVTAGLADVALRVAHGVRLGQHRRREDTDSSRHVEGHS
jgi:hypothetical protein